MSNEAERLTALLGFVARVSGAGSGPLGRLWLAAVALAMPLKMRVARGLAIPVWIRARRGPRLRFWIADRSELIALDEIFVQEEYAAAVAPGARTVVDLGANVGLALAWFKAAMPSIERSLAVEADPRTFARLQRNVGSLPGVTCVHAAVADRNGTTRFHLHPLSWASSMTPMDESVEIAEVPLITLDSLLDDHGLATVDVLKIDVEGAEWEVLSHSARLSALGTVVGEMHLERIPVSEERFLELFDGRDIAVDRRHPTRRVFHASAETARSPDGAG